MPHLALAALTWDPQLRGVLIVLTAMLILPGSVYLLLATNVGAKVGLLLAIAGLSGWLFLLNIVWLGYGIGYKGSTNGWKIKEIVTGDLVEHSGVKAVIAGSHGKPFPDGWTFLAPGTPLLATALPVADKALTPPPATSTAKPPAFPPPFKLTSDYVAVGAYTIGGHNYLVNLFGYKVYWRIRHHPIYVKHQPHYLVIRVQPSLKPITLAGAAATLPAPDITQPITSVVMQRDVGSLRLPPILLGFTSFLVFALTCENLHHRDKEIARRKAEEESGGTSPPGGPRQRELQPA